MHFTPGTMDDAARESAHHGGAMLAREVRLRYAQLLLCEHLCRVYMPRDGSARTHAGRPRHATSSACALMYRERRHFWCGKERMQACRRAPWRCPWFKEGSAAQYRARAPRVCRSGLPGSCKTARLWPAPNAGASGCALRAAPGEGPHPAAQRRAPLRMSAFGWCFPAYPEKQCLLRQAGGPPSRHTHAAVPIGPRCARACRDSHPRPATLCSARPEQPELYKIMTQRGADTTQGAPTARAPPLQSPVAHGGAPRSSRPTLHPILPQPCPKPRASVVQVVVVVRAVRAREARRGGGRGGRLARGRRRRRRPVREPELGAEAARLLQRLREGLRAGAAEARRARPGRGAHAWGRCCSSPPPPRRTGQHARESSHSQYTNTPAPLQTSPSGRPPPCCDTLRRKGMR
jgi:hypothetical protein